MSKTGTQMPSLEGATEWFNATGARAAEEAKGRPTLVYFWSVSCDTCTDAMARVSAWRDAHEEGLHVIAVHAPHEEADADTEQVREAVALRNITEPCAVDNERKLREAFGNTEAEVPAYYLYDAEGKLHTFAAGEGGLNTIGAALEHVLDAHAGGKKAAS